MYIRIQQKAIKFRVSQDEAHSLLNGLKLTDAIAFSPQSILSYSVESTEQESFFQFDDDLLSLTICVNQLALQEELEQRPSKLGIIIGLTENGDQPQQITLEIDLKRSR